MLRIINFLKKWFEGLERWISSYEHWLLFALPEILSSIPAHPHGSSWLSTTVIPQDLMPLSGVQTKYPYTSNKSLSLFLKIWKNPWCFDCVFVSFLSCHASHCLVKSFDVALLPFSWAHVGSPRIFLTSSFILKSRQVFLPLYAQRYHHSSSCSTTTCQEQRTASVAMGSLACCQLL